jgi:hypothetical protein
VFDTPTTPNFMNWTSSGARSRPPAPATLEGGLTGSVCLEDIPRQDER